MTSPSFGQAVKPEEVQQETESSTGPSTQDGNSIEQAEHEASREILNFEKILQESKHREEQLKKDVCSGGGNSQVDSSPDSAEEVFEVDRNLEVEMPVSDSVSNAEDPSIPSSSAAVTKCSNGLSVMQAVDAPGRRHLVAGCYDEVDASSEDSASVMYSSNFKLWPRDGTAERKPREGSTESDKLPISDKSVKSSCVKPRVMLSSSSDYNPQEEGGVIWDNETSLEQDACSCPSEATVENCVSRTEALWGGFSDSCKVAPGEEMASEQKHPPEPLPESSHVTVSDVSS